MLDYPLTPRKISASSVNISSIRVQFEEASYEQRVATRLKPKHTFKLEHSYIDKADEQKLV
jgi:hypothetical protein